MLGTDRNLLAFCLPTSQVQQKSGWKCFLNMLAFWLYKIIIFNSSSRRILFRTYWSKEVFGGIPVPSVTEEMGNVLVFNTSRSGSQTSACINITWGACGKTDYWAPP